MSQHNWNNCINLVLVEPEIPPNTGNIARTCAATGAGLHLIRPLGFSLENKYLRRAGLDYWDNVKLQVYQSLDEFFKVRKEISFYLVTKKAQTAYTQFVYPLGTFFLFGKETQGLPDALLQQYKDQCIRIPMNDKVRSLNLSNAAAIILYEALRQNNFPAMCI